MHLLGLSRVKFETEIWPAGYGFWVVRFWVVQNGPKSANISSMNWPVAKKASPTQLALIKKLYLDLIYKLSLFTKGKLVVEPLCLIIHVRMTYNIVQEIRYNFIYIFLKMSHVLCLGLHTQLNLEAMLLELCCDRLLWIFSFFVN